MAEGFLNLWKPPGISSHEAVARVRRATGISRVGHAGTLDPGAAGVLPLALGAFTRLLPYLCLTPKVYRAEVRSGTLTWTGDADGEISARSPQWSWTVEQLAWAAHWLEGRAWQVPPQVSALKIKGLRQYRAVRRGAVVWPQPRRVDIARIGDISVTADGWSFRAEVGSGTYVRALVRDWAVILGQAAHLAALARERVGSFDQSDSVALEQIEEAGSRGRLFLRDWQQHLSLPVSRITEDVFLRVVHGDLRALGSLRDEPPGARALVFQERLVAIVDGPPWRYRAVFGEVI